MGLILDTNILIHLEKMGAAVKFPAELASEEIAISVVTISELLVGVHRADTEERRVARSAFVERMIASVAAIDFTTAIARIHAEIHAELVKKGQVIGAHDLIIAATALFHGASIMTDNVKEFSR